MYESLGPDPENKVCWLWLEMIFGTASPKPLELSRHQGSCRDLFYTLHDPDCALLDTSEKRRLRQTSLHKAEELLTYCEKNGIGIMTWDSKSYPESLRHIYNPPVVLFYRGDVSLLHEKLLLTVVGTRNPSEYSCRVASWLCHDLARCGLILVSGCALGLDSIAHQSALDEGMPTIGVMGCGIDIDYPMGNGALRGQMAEKGLLITEYFPGTRPFGGNFPVRNRILAGISEAVLVTEAGARSGSLITANLACEQGKQVFCIPPHDLFDTRYSGVYSYLRDGAFPVFNHADVLYSYYLKYPHRLAMFDEELTTRTQDSMLFGRGDEKQKTASPKRTAAKPAAPPAEKPEAAAKPRKLPEGLTEEQKRLVKLLANGGQNLNAICMLLEMDFSAASMLVTEAELMGLIENTQRDIYTLCEDLN